jgi:hypothetical protein
MHSETLHRVAWYKFITVSEVFTAFVALMLGAVNFHEATPRNVPEGCYFHNYFLL